MKIAICYNGYLREVMESFPNIVEMLSLQNHDCDFFLHTWKHETEYKDELNYFFEHAKPKMWLIDNPRDFEQHPYYYKNLSDINWDELTPDKFNKSEFVITYPHNVLSQYYSKHSVNQLRKTYCGMVGKTHDLVICLRSDIYFNQKINYDEIDYGKMNTTWGEHMGQQTMHDPIMVRDTHGMGSERVMNCYFDCNLTFPTTYFVYRKDFLPEILLGFHLKSNGIESNYLNMTCILSKKIQQKKGVVHLFTQ